MARRAPVTVVCVLKSGGDYDARHVAWLQRQLPGHDVVCFSDVFDTPGANVRLAFKFPGWWSKLEICRLSVLGGDVLYFDLDSVVVGDIRPLIEIGQTTLLRDFYFAEFRPHKLQSSIMYLTEKDRAQIWNVFSADPKRHMLEHETGGDQRFLETVIPDCERWQDVLPGKLVSYKVHIRDAGLTEPPEGTAAVVFHGQPRPWQVKDSRWISPLE